jgi:hypothetical protein
MQATRSLKSQLFFPRSIRLRHNRAAPLRDNQGSLPSGDN